MNMWGVGDIHGHYWELTRLYKQMLAGGLKPEEDIVVYLGDYVDGGPDVKKVINWCIKKQKLYPHWVFLFGNHESLMLDAFSSEKPVYNSYDLWYKQGGEATTDSYISKKLTYYERALVQPKDIIPKKHLDWLNSLPLYYETDKYFFIHGGIYPNFSINDQVAMIKHDFPSGFKPSLMTQGDIAYDMIWMREPFIKSNYDWGKKIIFGHTTMKTPLVMNNKIGIDGMFHNTGKLFAVKLPEEKFFIQESRDQGGIYY